MAWLKAHKLQILVLVLSVLVGAGLHWKMLTTDQAVAFGALLAALGIHLPAVVYKIPPVIGSMLMAFGAFLVGAFALSVVMLACSAPTVAKLEYGGQLKACDEVSLSRSEDENCKTEVRNRWNEAGAPPAAIADGGVQ